ncbi:TetR/AcrR family transcriptional regulator [Microlunatus elymi]|uniref:TetR/AcrR family transcriptional regulator n=1 Tax=Microlunatus elymi TaxID=2596828 RepID=A0A516PU41_9ACTN|nr:TetR/AcrR family transcriptional regulator [Microlunatus elymi]QDP94659.1 TetR/AcrR family transcriptional regulator [Microlunatus elymi]
MTSSTAAQAASVSAPSARRTQTRERLINAAVGVFAERGIIGASVEEISDRAGFTRGAFYSNFADKDALVLAIVQHDAERDLQAVQDISEALMNNAELAASAPESLINIALTRLFGDAAHDRDAMLARHEMKLYAIRRPALRTAYRSYLDELYGRIGGLVDRAMTAIGIEFTVDYQVAIPMLHACSDHIEMGALLADAPADTAPMEALIKAISRPVGGCSEGGQHTS